MNVKKYGILSHIAHVQWLQFSLIFFFAGCFGLKKSEESKLVVVNVLDKDYFEDCHIAGSINVPFEQVEDVYKNWDKNARYVFYCSNYQCTAAPFAAKMLLDDGFTDVLILPGGMVDWYQQGFPCTGHATKSYLKEPNESLDDDHMGVPIISSVDLYQQMNELKK